MDSNQRKQTKNPRGGVKSAKGAGTSSRRATAQSRAKMAASVYRVMNPSRYGRSSSSKKVPSDERWVVLNKDTFHSILNKAIDTMTDICANEDPSGEGQSQEEGESSTKEDESENGPKPRKKLPNYNSKKTTKSVAHKTTPCKLVNKRESKRMSKKSVKECEEFPIENSQSPLADSSTNAKNPESMSGFTALMPEGEQSALLKNRPLVCAALFGGKSTGRKSTESNIISTAISGNTASEFEFNDQEIETYTVQNSTGNPTVDTNNCMKQETKEHDTLIEYSDILKEPMSTSTNINSSEMCDLISMESELPVNERVPRSPSPCTKQHAIVNECDVRQSVDGAVVTEEHSQQNQQHKTIELGKSTPQDGALINNDNNTVNIADISHTSECKQSEHNVNSELSELGDSGVVVGGACEAVIGENSTDTYTDNNFSPTNQCAYDKPNTASQDSDILLDNNNDMSVKSVHRPSAQVNGLMSKSNSNMKTKENIMERQNWVSVSKSDLYNLVENLIEARLDEDSDNENGNEPKNNSGKPENKTSPSNNVHGKLSYLKYGSRSDNDYKNSVLANNNSNVKDSRGLSSKMPTSRLSSLGDQNREPLEGSLPGAPLAGRGNDKSMDNEACRKSMSNAHTQHVLKQCWVALNQDLIFNMVEQAIKQDDENSTEGRRSCSPKYDNIDHNQDPLKARGSSLSSSPIGDAKADRRSAERKRSYDESVHGVIATRKRKFTDDAGVSDDEEKIIDTNEYRRSPERFYCPPGQFSTNTCPRNSLVLDYRIGEVNVSPINYSLESRKNSAQGKCDNRLRGSPEARDLRQSSRSPSPPIGYIPRMPWHPGTVRMDHHIPVMRYDNNENGQDYSKSTLQSRFRRAPRGGEIVRDLSIHKDIERSSPAPVAVDERRSPVNSHQSPKLGWVAVSKSEVHDIVNSVMESMIIDDDRNSRSSDVGSMSSEASSVPNQSLPKSNLQMSPSEREGDTAPQQSSSGTHRMCSPILPRSSDRITQQSQGSPNSPVLNLSLQSKQLNTDSPEPHQSPSQPNEASRLSVRTSSITSIGSTASGDSESTDKPPAFKWKKHILRRCNEEEEKKIEEDDDSSSTGSLRDSPPSSSLGESRSTSPQNENKNSRRNKRKQKSH